MIKRFYLLLLIAIASQAASAWIIYPWSKTDSTALAYVPTGDFSGSYNLAWVGIGDMSDSRFLATLTFSPGRVACHPWRGGSSRFLHVYKGNSLKISADDLGSPNEVRDILNVEIDFSSDANGINGADGITASVSGKKTYNNGVFTWEGRAKTVEFFFDDVRASSGTKAFVGDIYITLGYRNGEKAVAHPVFSPIDQHEFKDSETVTITCPTEGAKIFYCMDDRSANAEFTEYTGPININKTTFFRAYCVKDTLVGGEDTCKIVHNPTPFLVKDETYYKQFKYTWTDINGDTHENDVTEEATSPEQIMALLYEIYTNSEIPGQIYMNKSEPVSYCRYTTPVKREYRTGWVTRTANVWDKFWPNYYKIGSKAVGIPVLEKDPLEGYTTLLVKVRPDFDLNYYNMGDNDFTPKSGDYKHGNTDDGKQYLDETMPGTQVTYDENPVYKMISEAYESVKMVFGRRIEEEGKGFGDDNYQYSPGTFYTFSLEAARFFLISKGSACWGARYPLAGMFEEFSPHADNHHNVYGTLQNGDVFYGTHACPSVVYMGHDFTLNEDHSIYNIDNMTFFIPDYRLKFWEQNTMQDRWTSDVKDFTKNRNFSGTQGINWYHPRYMPSTFEYTINLMAGDNDPQASGNDREFVNHLSWISTLDKLENNSHPQTYVLYQIIEDEDGNEVERIELTSGTYNPGETHTFDHIIAQQQYGFEINYIIKSKPTDINYDYVTSNKVTLRIPGYDEKEDLKLVNRGYESRYDYINEKNIYANYIGIENGTKENEQMLANMLKVGDKMRIYRLDSKNDELFKVATVEITSKTPDDDADVNDEVKFEYSIKMNKDSQWDKDDSKYPATTGTFTAPGKFKVVDFGGLYVTDQFSEGTVDNDHQSRFHYQLILNEEHITSNTITIPVQKTIFSVNDLPFSKSDIDNDTDHSLQLTASVSLNTLIRNDESISHYEIKRYAEDVQTASRATRSKDDTSYTTSNADENGELVDDITKTTFSSGETRKNVVMNDGYVEWGGSYNYYPVITTKAVTTPLGVVENTYGGTHSKAFLSNVNVAITDLVQTGISWFDNDGKPFKYYSADIEVEADIPSADRSTVMIRVWRVNSDGSETLLNNETDIYGGDEDAPVWATSYYKIKDLYPGNDIKVHDIFSGPVLGAGQSMDITYIVRLYTTDYRDDVDESSGPSEAPGRKSAKKVLATATYNVAEKTYTVTYDKTVRTEIYPVVVNNATPTHVIYYNPLGVESDRPFDGINVIVTQYSDGTTTTEKAIK